MSRLKVGASALKFIGEDLHGNMVNLTNFKGQKVYLAFFRKAACPFCNMGLQELIRKHDEFEKKGIKVIALFASPKAELLKYAGKQKAPFPIIADGNYKIYDQYGIKSSVIGMLMTSFNPVKVLKAIKGDFFSAKTTFQDPVMPADFLLDEMHNVMRAHYGKTYDDHLSVNEILEWDTSAIYKAV